MPLSIKGHSALAWLIGALAFVTVSVEALTSYWTKVQYTALQLFARKDASPKRTVFIVEAWSYEGRDTIIK